MCQVQIVKRFGNKTLTKKDIESFSNLMFYGSSSNDDAHGVFSEDGVILKSNIPLDYYKLYNEVKGVKSNFLIGHNRYKTKGKAEIMENNHPFETDNFIVVHNGILRNDEELKKEYDLAYEIETDSYIISALLEHFYKEDNNELLSIKKVAELIKGTYSVLVYHKPSKRTFYFKEGNTDFCFALIKTQGWDLLVGSTDKDNISLSFGDMVRGVFSLPITYAGYEPEKHIIYEITETELIKVDMFVEATSYSLTQWKGVTQTGVGIKDVYKGIATGLVTELNKFHKIEVSNRNYDYQNKTITLTTKGELDTAQKVYIEEDCISIGNTNFNETTVGGKVIKTEIVITLDSDVINDYKAQQVYEGGGYEGWADKIANHYKGNSDWGYD